MRKLTPEQIARTGTKAVVCGQVVNKWSMDDKDTGEVISGAKLTWYGGNGSVQFWDPKQEDLFVEGDVIEVECDLTNNKGAYKVGKGSLLAVNGNPLGAKQSAKPA